MNLSKPLCSHLPEGEGACRRLFAGAAGAGAHTGAHTGAGGGSDLGVLGALLGIFLRIFLGIFLGIFLLGIFLITIQSGFRII